MLFADIGVPMLALYWPVAWVALIPIIYLEGKIGSKSLDEPIETCRFVSLIANIASTLVGIPVTWGLLVAIEMHDGGKGYGLDTFPDALYAVTVQAPWLIPYGRDLAWMVPVAIVVLSVAFYVMSVAVELLLAKWFFRSHSWKRLLQWMIVANAWSYGLLIVMTIIWAGIGTML